MTHRIPVELLEIAYVAPDGRAAWSRADLPNALRELAQAGWAPRVVEAWMVFFEPPYAGTHSHLIWQGPDASSIHRTEIGPGRDHPDETWEAYTARCIAAAEEWLATSKAESVVHPDQRHTIWYHVGLEERDPEGEAPSSQP